MQTYHVKLESDVSKSYRCQRAADSLDIDATKKNKHELTISCDLETKFNVGLIVGASGAGKTTLARKIFPNQMTEQTIDMGKTILDQMPESMSYEDCANALNAIGLTSVPCWIRPLKTLSNGQLARAKAALTMLSDDKIIVIDEWTSVVDRTVAKVMSHCVQKFARKFDKQVILLSCHYDVIDWCAPDWLIDCNKQTYDDRRLLWREQQTNREKLKFDIKPIGRESWKYFSKYHYLSDKLPGGHNEFFGLFHNNEQIGFQAFSNYVPTRINTQRIMHSNRTVIHPDYAGLGLGIKLINATSAIMKNKNYRVMAKFSSTPVYKAMIKQKEWKLLKIDRPMKTTITGNIGRTNGYREQIKMYSFEWIG